MLITAFAKAFHGGVLEFLNTFEVIFGQFDVVGARVHSIEEGGRHC